MPDCTNCVHYSGAPTTLQKGEPGYDEYEGDNCASPENKETITNYYGTVVRYKKHPSEINDDNDCSSYYAHSDFEPPE